MSDLTPQQITVKEYKEIYGNFDKERLIQILIEDKLYIRKLHEQLYAEKQANGVTTGEKQCNLPVVNGSFLPKCNRVEVIDQSGRAYVNWKPTNKVEAMMQDDDRTLKVFIS